MSPRPAPHCDGRPAWSSFCLRQPTPSPRLLMHRGGLTPRLTPKRDAVVRTESLPWSKVSTSSLPANVGQVEGSWTGLPSLCDPAACQRRRQCREVGGDEGWRGSILRPSERACVREWLSVALDTVVKKRKTLSSSLGQNRYFVLPRAQNRDG